MAAPPQHRWTREDYQRDAREYLASLPLEHFMESTPQATQREITMASFAVLRTRIPTVRYFSELLIHHYREGGVLRVVPDNMVVLGPLDDEPRNSYALDLEPYPVFWTLEYVSESNRRKDYVENFEIYETQLRVPYYLIFDPEHQDLRLYHLPGERYSPVLPNAMGRHPLPELDLEMGLLDGWVRYWHRGELVPLPVELLRQTQELADLLRQSKEELRQSREETRQRDEELRRTQEENLKREEAIRQRDEELRRSREEARLREEELRRTQEENLKREEELRRSREEARLREEELRRWQEHDQALVGALRPLVEVKARQAGRQDILEQLPAGDGQRLAQWLAELA